MIERAQVPRILAWLVAAGLTIALIAAVAGSSGRALALSDPDPGDGSENQWLSHNLSRSGAASEPQLVAGVDGRFHLLWRDAFDGFVYSSGDGVEWSEPVAPELPFATRRYFFDLRFDSPTPLFTPRLFADQAGRIHAFWNDGEGVLYSSSVPAGDFADYGAWAPRQQLSSAGRLGDAAGGPAGGLHLAYVRTGHTAEAPAGVYYRRWDPAEESWSEPLILHASLYFRLWQPDEARLALAADELGRVLVAWDDPYRGQIYHARSADNGLVWTESEQLFIGELAGLPESSGADEEGEGEEEGEGLWPTLGGLLASLGEGEMHLLWQASDGEDCTGALQSSADASAHWGPAQLIPADDCAPVRQLLQDDANRVVVHFGGGAADTLLAWDGVVWSDPFTLPAGLNDPETGRQVRLGCEQVALMADGRTLLVGCDEAGGDIWLLSQAENTTAAELFVTPTPTAPPPTLVWGTPVSLSPDRPETPLELRQPSIVADSEGRFHLVWSEPAEDDPAGLGRTITYVRWADGRWSRPIPLFSLGNEKAETPALAAGPDGRVHLVWSGGQSGEILYSQAQGDRTVGSGEWSEPIVLPMIAPAGTSPAIVVGRDKTIHVVYALPLNEGRGVYYTRSADRGESWSEPLAVVDAAAAAWPMIDHPTLAVGGDGTLHVAWTALPLPGSLLPSAIYYSHSADNGATWSEPFEAATDGEPDWPQLLAVGELQLHLLWGERSGRELRQHRYSADNGATLSRAGAISGLNGIQGPVGLATDAAARVHLAAVGGGWTYSSVGPSVQHRLWDGERWLPVEADGEPTTLPPGTAVTHASLAIAPDGRLALAFRSADPLPVELPHDDNEEDNAESELTRTFDTGQLVVHISFLSRSLALPAERPTPLPTLTPTPPPTPAPTTTPTPQPTPTMDLSAGGAAELELGPLALPGEYAGLIIGAVPAGLIVLIGFLIGARMLRGGRR